MEHQDATPKEASAKAWEELCGLLSTACANSGGRLDFRRPDEFSLLIQEKNPPRALRLEYSPELKKLRYNTGASGWQELKAVENPRGIVFETPYHHEYTVWQLSERAGGIEEVAVLVSASR